MRRAMICVSFMLAILQLWPVVFGQGTEAGAAIAAAPVAVTKVTPAVAQVAVKPLAKKANSVGGKSMPTCFQQYERKFAACGGGNAQCQLQAGDHWDVCEATGFWPE